MDDSSEGSLIEIDHALRQDLSQNQEIINKPVRRRVTIDILDDDVLLEIFDHYADDALKRGKYEEWQMLVHVCQKWRYIVFRSPLRLNLQILCSEGTPVREKLAVWPPLPIKIVHHNHSPRPTPGAESNIMTALVHTDRVCEIDLVIRSSILDRVFPAMQKTFVALKHLRFNAMSYTAPIVPDSFLGGSAPHLQHLTLIRIPFPFPVLRKLLLSTHDLVLLRLSNIRHSWYISPEEMVTCLTGLTKLKHLWIGFESVPPPPLWERQRALPTRTVLPALTELRFFGVSDYLEYLVSGIDSPLLIRLHVEFFPQAIFHTPQLVQFISRTPKLNACDEARVIFSKLGPTIALRWRGLQGLKLGISGLDLPMVSDLAQVCTLTLPQALLPMAEHLYILEDVILPPLWQDDRENNRWLEFFHPFTSVKNLYLSREFVPRIAPAMQELVGERVTEVLPNLQRIFLKDLDSEEPVLVPEAMRKFVAARQLSSPIAISSWTGQDKGLDDLSI